MERIRLPELSRAAAEAALVKLWCRLEEYGLSTPKLDVVFDNNDTVHISLLFADPVQAKMALQGWARAVQPVGRPRPKRASSAV